jgi:hypothetical protein
MDKKQVIKENIKNRDLDDVLVDVIVSMKELNDRIDFIFKKLNITSEYNQEKLDNEN